MAIAASAKRNDGYRNDIDLSGYYFSVQAKVAKNAEIRHF